jgi:hypothetical protein
MPPRVPTGAQHLQPSSRDRYGLPTAEVKPASEGWTRSPLLVERPTIGMVAKQAGLAVDGQGAVGCMVCDHAATGLLGDSVHDGSASTEELAALRVAVLRHHEQFLRMEPKPRSQRMVRRLARLHLSWLLIPWFLVLTVRFFLSGSWRGLSADEQHAVRLYRRLSGKDPRVAQAEVWRIGQQLGSLDERLRGLDEERSGRPRGADPAELEAATGALVGYYVAGRRTDDELLADVEAAWAECEELIEQRLARATEGGRFRHRTDPMLDERVEASADRHRAAWRRWFDRPVERGPAGGGGHPQNPRSVRP